jgi:predicted nucleic acid-binding protein
MLVDTNVLSELRKRKFGGADPRVAAWSLTVPLDEMWISAVTVMELEKGVLLMERRDAKQGARLRLWLMEDILAPFQNRILPFEERAALRCALLHSPNRKPELDAMLAATAFVHGLTIATRNERDFVGMGVAVFNPWEFSGTA